MLPPRTRPIKWGMQKENSTGVMFCFVQSIFRPNNMIAQSQSGTGKTAAFVLSMLSRVDATKKFTQVKF